MLRRLILFNFLMFIGSIGCVQAQVVARIDKSQQTMHVYVDGQHLYTWPVSTARAGYRTPVGVYRPYQLSVFHRSSRYGGSPMPHSVFFSGGYAIHGSYEIGHLGIPASHGCIRLHPAHAREFFWLVQSYGMDDTRIIITN